MLCKDALGEDNALKLISDPYVVSTEEVIKDLYVTPIKRFYDAQKEMLDKLSTYLITSEIEHGRDGNISNILTIFKDTDKIIGGFKKAESSHKEELIGRGGMTMGYDID